MNFLAHAYLAGDDEAHRLGGLMGDFIKGPLPGGLRPDLAAGVALHRRIDSYAERHPAFRQSRARVSAARRRYAGIMVDMFYDHFLAHHWSRYHAEPLEDYTDGIYRMLARRVGCLPQDLAEIAPRMASQDWLGSYARVESIATALDRMARYRLRQPNNLAGAGEELLEHYAGFEEDFHVFIDDAKGMASGFDFSRLNWLGLRDMSF